MPSLRWGEGYQEILDMQQVSVSPTLLYLVLQSEVWNGAVRIRSVLKNSVSHHSLGNLWSYDDAAPSAWRRGRYHRLGLPYIMVILILLLFTYVKYAVLAVTDKHICLFFHFLCHCNSKGARIRVSCAPSHGQAEATSFLMTTGFGMFTSTAFWHVHFYSEQRWWWQRDCSNNSLLFDDVWFGMFTSAVV